MTAGFSAAKDGIERHDDGQKAAHSAAQVHALQLAPVYEHHSSRLWHMAAGQKRRT
jgi:hypothetical protein